MFDVVEGKVARQKNFAESFEADIRSLHGLYENSWRPHVIGCTRKIHTIEQSQALHPYIPTTRQPIFTDTAPTSRHRQYRNHGSHAQQRKGYLQQQYPILARKAGMAQDHLRPGRGADPQDGQEGHNTINNRLNPP